MLAVALRQEALELTQEERVQLALLQAKIRIQREEADKLRGTPGDEALLQLIELRQELSSLLKQAVQTALVRRKQCGAASPPDRDHPAGLLAKLTTLCLRSPAA